MACKLGVSLFEIMTGIDGGIFCSYFGVWEPSGMWMVRASPPPRVRIWLQDGFCVYSYS